MVQQNLRKGFTKMRRTRTLPQPVVQRINSSTESTLSRSCFTPEASGLVGYLCAIEMAPQNTLFIITKVHQARPRKLSVNLVKSIESDPVLNLLSHNKGPSQVHAVRKFLQRHSSQVKLAKTIFNNRVTTNPPSQCVQALNQDLRHIARNKRGYAIKHTRRRQKRRNPI